MGYQPDWNTLNIQGHKAPVPEMPPTPTTPLSPEVAVLMPGIKRDIGDGGPVNSSNDYYNYAILASLLGSAGAGLGQAFHPWIRPPQPLPSPQAPQMPVTAPASIQALAQTHSSRKGY